MGDTTYFINLFNIDLKDVFRTTQCLSVAYKNLSNWFRRFGDVENSNHKPIAPRR